MNFNFFDWIRDGVKQSVLLGVSDAVEQMGMPPEQEESRKKILTFLQQEASEPVPARRRLPNSSATPRKLGRSIADIHPEK